MDGDFVAADRAALSPEGAAVTQSLVPLRYASMIVA